MHTETENKGLSSIATTRSNAVHHSTGQIEGVMQCNCDLLGECEGVPLNWCSCASATLCRVVSTGTPYCKYDECNIMYKNMTL